MAILHVGSSPSYGRLTSWTAAVYRAIFLVYFVIVVIGMHIAGNIPHQLIFMLLQYSFVSLIFGCCLYVIMLPFIILTLRSSFFHERLCTCLHLESTSKTVDCLVEAGSSVEWKPDSEMSKDGD